MRYLLILLLVLSACGSTKNTKREVSEERVEQLQGITELRDSLFSAMQLQRKEIKEKLSNIKIENKTTYLSVPDSSGRQYPTVISESRSEQEDKESAKIDTELRATLEEVNYKIDVLFDAVHSINSEREKVVSLSWWQRYKSDIILSLLLFAVLWLVYKQRNK